MSQPLPMDVVIFGGGAAGLWLLDELTRAGVTCLLLEANDLGSGQTIASQGIIHGGLKYTLSGLFTPSAKAIAEMPLIWRRCLAGEAQPNLAATRLRAEYCYLWRTASLRSKLAMIGARAGLRVAPVTLAREERPVALANVPGMVARLDEQVIDPVSFINVLSQRHVDRILKIDAGSGLEIEANTPGDIAAVRLLNPDSGEPLDLKPTVVVFAAGAGNASLRRAAGFKDEAMQRRPLHMVMMRGFSLPILNGHCVDGKATRATITSARDYDDRIVWQIGGQIAERGVTMEPEQLIAFAQSELRALLPGVRLASTEWGTYRVDRAEAAMGNGTRPENVFVQREGNTITAWPTKLALVPEMARRVMELQSPKSKDSKSKVTLESGRFRSWPRPLVALPPWETHERWSAAD